MEARTKYHRDGSVTFWDVYDQSWCRLPASHISARTLATLNDSERARIARMALTRRDIKRSKGRSR